MVDLEKQIEETAEMYAYDISVDFSSLARINSFIEGAKSEAAKAYHTKGMYSEEDLIEAIKFTISQWISDNERMEPDHRDLVRSFIHQDLPVWFEQNKKK